MEHRRHTLVVEFGYGAMDIFPLIDLEDRLIEVLLDSATGELDGNHLSEEGTIGELYFIGTDPDGILQVIAPVLLQSSILHHPVAILFPESPSERRVHLLPAAPARRLERSPVLAAAAPARH